MIDTVKTAFKERLDKNDWIDDTTRQASKDKVDAITKMVAYPDEISNVTYLNDLYAEVSVWGIDIYYDSCFFKLWQAWHSLSVHQHRDRE